MEGVGRICLSVNSSSANGFMRMTRNWVKVYNGRSRLMPRYDHNMSIESRFSLYGGELKRFTMEGETYKEDSIIQIIRRLRV